MVDLNNALVSAILTGYAGFTTSAGYVGPDIRVDHDISLLVPEIWCRMRVAERDPRFLIENGFLENVEDLSINGRTVLASRLGYRITSLFVDHFLGRIFETPSSVFPSEMLRPEEQDPELFAAGVDAIVETQRRVRSTTLRTAAWKRPVRRSRRCCIFWRMATIKEWEWMRPNFARCSCEIPCSPATGIRSAYASSRNGISALWQRHVAALETFRSGPGNVAGAGIDLDQRFELVRRELARVSSPAYLQELRGTIGADPFHCQITH